MTRADEEVTASSNNKPSSSTSNSKLTAAYSTDYTWRINMTKKVFSDLNRCIEVFCHPQIKIVFTLRHDSARGLSQPRRQIEHNNCVTLQTFHTQTRDKCGQSRPATGATPIVPLEHTRFVYTPERQTCLHTGPQWAPGNRERRKDGGYCECLFCNTSDKG